MTPDTTAPQPPPAPQQTSDNARPDAATSGPRDPSSTDPGAPAGDASNASNAGSVRRTSLQLLGVLFLLAGGILTHNHDQVEKAAALALHSSSALMHWGAFHILMRARKWTPVATVLKGAADASRGGPDGPTQG